MRWLIFLSRVAFLCGIMMLMAFSLLFANWNNGETISSAIITAGYGFALLIIPLVNILYLFLFLFAKKTGVSPWQKWMNFLFLVVLILYILSINKIISI
ncbi:MAG: hypothetical protein M9959_07905 [Chitinophagaceae bacterium]|nr:hypothetical protein [Chitinophagaceae bacterium]